MSITNAQKSNNSDKIETFKLCNLEYPNSIIHACLAEFKQHLGRLIDQKHVLLHNKKT